MLERIQVLYELYYSTYDDINRNDKPDCIRVYWNIDKPVPWQKVGLDNVCDLLHNTAFV
jgi:hypothetical protein